MPLILSFLDRYKISACWYNFVKAGIERDPIVLTIVKPPRMFPIIIAADLDWIANIWVLIVTEINDHLLSNVRVGQ